VYPGLQAYEQLVPSQVGVPVVESHFLPQPEQLLTLESVVQVPPQTVSWQEQVPPEQSGVGWAQGVPLTQVPAALHVSGVLPLHAVAFGEHCTQVPPRHTGVAPEHDASFCHAPPLHVWITLPRHWTAPALHATQVAVVMDVAVQTGVAPEHGVWFCQLPEAHTSTTVDVASHCVSPSTHVPMHAFPTQVELTHGVGAPHCPEPLHVW
jgi:hypothetical protein